MQANEAEQQAVDNRLAIFHAREFPGVQLKYHDRYRKHAMKVTVFVILFCDCLSPQMYAGYCYFAFTHITRV